MLERRQRPLQGEESGSGNPYKEEKVASDELEAAVANWWGGRGRGERDMMHERKKENVQ